MAINYDKVARSSSKKKNSSVAGLNIEERRLGKVYYKYKRQAEFKDWRKTDIKY